MIGIKIGIYEIIEELGSGTAVTSFLARDGSGKHVVVKRLADRLAADDSMVQKFMAVGDLSAQIRNRNYVAITVGKSKSVDGFFLIRQYVEGEPLSKYIREGTLGELNADQVGLNLCDAVRAMSQRGVVHGGIHPGNVIVRPKGQIKVTDFGLTLERLTGKVEDSYPLDALRYLSPEQWREEECTSKSDIYSIGLIIAMLRRNAEVFDAPDRRSLEAQVVAGHTADCPIVAAAVCPYVSSRYSDVGELRARLAEQLKTKAEKEKAEKKEQEKARKIAAEKEDAKKIEAEKEAAEKEAAEKKQTDGEGEAKPKADQPPPPPPPPAGSLESVLDMIEKKELLALSPEPWVIPRNGHSLERLLQMRNGGSGLLELEAACVGNGISVNPAQHDIPPGQGSTMIVRLDPKSAEWTDLVFTWKEEDEQRQEKIKIRRSG